MWGATYIKAWALLREEISIHAPVWGATAYRYVPESVAADFNPRARVGRDHNDETPRGQTGNFNPRARVGRDLAFWLPRFALLDFNPRARVGRDE